MKFGVALDIDGVLIRGGRLLSGTKHALQRLHNHRIPFIYLTNGGGVDERTKAGELSRKFGIQVHESQVCLSHSPMRELPANLDATHLKNASGRGLTLVIGPPSVKQVAGLYGFRKPVLPEDLLNHQPSLWPWHFKTEAAHNSTTASPDEDPYQNHIETVAVFHDSRDWGRDIQLICDALMSDRGMLGTRSPRLSHSSFEPDVKLYFSNPDLIWATDFPQPRFGQGAFKRAVEHLYNVLTHGQHKLPVAGQFGKPYPLTYQYAERMIKAIGREKGDDNQRLDRVYAVGDNPMSDILGANNFGWQSILVRTGVFQESTNLTALRLPDCAEFRNKSSSLLEPNTVCEDISEAVDYILTMENMISKDDV